MRTAQSCSSHLLGEESAQGDVSAGGISVCRRRRRVCLGMGVCPQGVSAQRYGLPDPPVNRMTDACENITFHATAVEDGNHAFVFAFSQCKWAP